MNLGTLLGRRRDGAEAPSRPQGPVIEFRCAEEDLGVIAEPVPARSALPRWFSRLPGLDTDQLSATCNGLTVKRCVPFLDALTLGWMIPVPATVRLEISGGGSEVKAGWEFDRELVSPHHPWQVDGNPWEPRPPMKLHCPWTITTHPGWSCLFVPPVNRPVDAIQVLSGVVDTDVYAAPVNFPFIATGADGVHVLERGTPLVQVVPFARAEVEGVVRAETEDEAAERERDHRSTAAAAGWYRSRSRVARHESACKSGVGPDV